MSRNLSISGEGRQRALMHGNPRNMLKTHFAGPAAGENRILDSTGGSLMLSRFLCAGICALSLASAATVSSQPTFYKDVRPWAKAIREAVLTKKMPPWFADAHYGKFANDRSLAQDEIDTLVSWE